MSFMHRIGRKPLASGHRDDDEAGGANNTTGAGGPVKGGPEMLQQWHCMHAEAVAVFEFESDYASTSL